MKDWKKSKVLPIAAAAVILAGSAVGVHFWRNPNTQPENKTGVEDISDISDESPANPLSDIDKKKSLKAPAYMPKREIIESLLAFGLENGSAESSENVPENNPLETPSSESSDDFSGSSSGNSSDNSSGFSQASLDEMIDEVLDSIIDDGMSKREQAYAVFKYANKKVRYVGDSIKSSWQEGAYEGLTTGKGDCYTYYALSRALLTALGIDNLEVTRVGGSDSHYWNLVNCGDGWYHFDAGPHNVPMGGPSFFMFTDQEAADYTAKAGRNYYDFDPSLYPSRAGGEGENDALQNQEDQTPAEGIVPLPAEKQETELPGEDGTALELQYDADVSFPNDLDVSTEFDNTGWLDAENNS